jgi:transcriptional regulator
MYNLPEYKEHDFEKIVAFMRANPFIVLSGVANNRPVATQVPVLIDEDPNGIISLRGHMMKGTDHYKAFLQNASVLAIFSGAHTYVSASWYTDKQQGSTWNYMSVHALGELHFLDASELIDILRETTSHFENDPASPSLYDHLPSEYIERLVKAIAGFRIDITKLDHVFKLSQNRDRESYENIILKLEGGDASSRQIAGEMKARLQTAYPNSNPTE